MALALAACVLLVACGDDGDDGAATTTTTTGPSTTEEGTSETSGPTSTVPPSADPVRLAEAEAAVLRQEDFPDGWSEHDPTAGLALELTWNDLLSCLGVPAGDQALGIATSPTFLQGLATQARSTVEYLPEDRVQAIGAALAGADLDRCLSEAISADAVRSAPEGGVPGPVTVSALDVPALGQATTAKRMNFTMKVEDLEIPIFQDLVVVLDGDTVTRLVFLNPGGPFPPSLQRTLIETVVGRA